MTKLTVKSSDVASIGWEATGSGLKYWMSPAGTCEVTFRTGTTYRYADVPYSIYLQVLGSDSVGSAFAKLIKPYFAYTRAEGK